MVFNSKEAQTIEDKYDIQKMSGNWLKLEEGENKVKFVSEVLDFGAHNDSVLKRRVICLGKDYCPYCKKGEKSSVRFYVWVIERKTNKIKLFEFGYSIYEQIKDIRAKEDYAFDGIPPFDFEITRKGEGLSTKYKVLPCRNDSKLTEEEQSMIEKECTSLEEIVQRRKDKKMKELGEVKPVIENQKVEKTDDKIILAPVKE